MTNRFNKYLRQYFGFSHVEIRGFFVLVPLTIFILYIPEAYRTYLSSLPSEKNTADAQILEEWKIELRGTLNANSKDFEIIPKHFEPNMINADQWKKMGFSEKVSRRIVNYVSKGGRFNKKEDLLKIYGIDTSLVEAYYDYMYLLPKPKLVKKLYQGSTQKQQEQPSFTKKPKVEKPKKVIHNLCNADTTQLKTIRGIGSYWARRIVDYRESLGGYVSKMQLYEMYYMKDSIADLVLDNTYFQKVPVQKINVNTASVDELDAHPYINYKTANSIVKYRNQHNEYQKLEDLKKVVVLKTEVYEKIQPYLKLQD